MLEQRKQSHFLRFKITNLRLLQLYLRDQFFHGLHGIYLPLFYRTLVASMILTCQVAYEKQFWSIQKACSLKTWLLVSLNLRTTISLLTYYFHLTPYSTSNYQGDPYEHNLSPRTYSISAMHQQVGASSFKEKYWCPHTRLKIEPFQMLRKKLHG